MTATAYPGPFSPDSPAQRLPWILLLAILLVLLGVVGLGRILKAPARPPHKPKPLQARIYELPASRGAAAAKATSRPRRQLPTHPLHQRPPEQNRPHPRPAPPTPTVAQPQQHSQAAAPEVQAKKGIAVAQPSPVHRPAAPPAATPRRKSVVQPAPRRHKAVVHHAPPRHKAVVHHAPRRHKAVVHHTPRRHKAVVLHHAPRLPKAVLNQAPQLQHASPQGQPNLNWAMLQSQINNAVQQSTPSPPQIHDPHTLVARYYIASLLQKLQRIGDMNYPTNLTGVPVLRMVIGSRGQLLQLTLLRSSGNNTLDRDALDIAKESAPFSPFPDRLKRQTSHIELVCFMSFNGYRQLYAGY